jgi:hypothetical protein
MKIVCPARLVRVERALVVFFLLTLSIAGASCKRSEVAGNANGGTGTGETPAGETFTTPPFSTKEPERYQAKVVTAGSLGENSNIPGMSLLKTREMLVARDGERRRMDAEPAPGMKMSFLQLPSGTYVLVPEKKIYAEFAPGGAKERARNLSSDFSPDKLLNQFAGGARYEKLGAEDLNGRATMKYRVTLTSKSDEGKGGTTESLIWIDDALGMPVKSETTVTGGQMNGVKFSMELRDIRQDVDQSLFELPPDYKKVDYQEIQRQMMSSGSP